MDKKKRLVTAIVSAVYIFILLFSIFFIAAEADHICCVKDNCPVCCQINACKNNIKNVNTAGGLVFASAVAVFVVILSIGNEEHVSSSTLVMLKIKLSN
ncbi:MAG: hypothetical protein ACI4V4_06645 [Eubacterium sp.]